jgi:hypothetical protein
MERATIEPLLRNRTSVVKVKRPPVDEGLSANRLNGHYTTLRGGRKFRVEQGSGLS